MMTCLTKGFTARVLKLWSIYQLSVAQRFPKVHTAAFDTAEVLLVPLDPKKCKEIHNDELI